MNMGQNDACWEHSVSGCTSLASWCLGAGSTTAAGSAPENRFTLLLGSFKPGRAGSCKDLDPDLSRRLRFKLTTGNPLETYVPGGTPRH